MTYEKSPPYGCETGFRGTIRKTTEGLLVSHATDVRDLPENAGLFVDLIDIGEAGFLYQPGDRGARGKFLVCTGCIGKVVESRMSSFCKVDNMHGCTGLENAMRFAECRKFRIRPYMVKHEGRQYCVERSVGERELLAKGLTEFDIQTSSMSLLARTG